MIHMGKKLKQLRWNYALTQKQVSTRLGISISALSSYENNYRYPSYSVLRKLAVFYHVSTDYLLGLTEEA